MVYFLLGTPFFERKGPFSDRIRELTHVVRRIFECTVKLTTIPAELARRLNLKLWKNYIDSVNQSFKICEYNIEDDINLPSHFPFKFRSFFFVLASELLVDMYKCDNAGDGILRAMLDLNLSTDLIHRIVVDFIIAAGDTVCENQNIGLCGVKIFNVKISFADCYGYSMAVLLVGEKQTYSERSVRTASNG